MKYIGAVVHYLDIGGEQPPQAAGIESVLAGLRASFTDEKDKSEFLDMIQGEHRRIFEAISARRADDARAAMRQHLEGGRRRYREWSLTHDVDKAT